MIHELRRDFNSRWTPEGYETLKRNLTGISGVEIPFRISETPVFFERELLEKMARYGAELVTQIIGNTAYLAEASAHVPEWFRAPNASSRPLFVQADFGIDERGEPMLVEIQGFPSLYAFQSALAEAYRTAYDIPQELSSYFSSRHPDDYLAKLRKAIVSDHDPASVVLMEIEPIRQKTYCDFALTERYLGVRTVGVTDIIREGNRLFYRHEGKLVSIERIYNRVIAEEFERTHLPIAFDWRDDLEIEWAGHPSWYFLLSKFSLPYFNHPSVPESHFLDRAPVDTLDLKEWVIKPLFSFAGQGVKVSPTSGDIASVTAPSQYVLQRKVNFVPVLETPAGPTKVETRIMYIWEDNHSLPTPLTALIRSGRGALMGVDANRNATWVGASAAFF